MANQIYYKVLNADRSCRNGGKGTWPKYPQYLEVKGQIIACQNGLHICTAEQLLTGKWLSTNIWTVEIHPDATVVNNNDKTVVSKARLRQKTIMSTKNLIQFAVDCAEHVLHIYENKYPNDDRVRNAIKTVKNKKATTVELNAAYAAAANAANAAAANAGNAAANAGNAAANAAYAAYAAAYAAYAAYAAAANAGNAAANAANAGNAAANAVANAAANAVANAAANAVANAAYAAAYAAYAAYAAAANAANAAANAVANAAAGKKELAWQVNLLETKYLKVK